MYGWGVSPSERYLPSRATPTTSRNGPSGPFTLTRLPRASSPGQSVAASVSLSTTTPGAPLTICLRKIAPAQQRRFHSLEIVRAHHVEAGADAFICLPLATTLRKDLELRVGETELREPHQARALDARLRLDPGEQIAVEVFAFSFSCSATAPG